MTSVNELNLDEILLNWVQETNEYWKIFNFDLSQVKFEHCPPKFENGLHSQGQPNTEIIFQDVFRNDTACTHKHRIRSERQTTSFAKFDLSQAIVYEKKHLLKLYDLPASCTGSSGFSAPLVVDRLGSQEFVEKLTWVLDDEITVPPRSTTRAEVIITEQTHETAFQVKTKIRGNVHCNVIDDRDDSIFTTVDGDIQEILYNHVQENGKLKGLELQQGSANFRSKGTCKFRYGVSKVVNVYSE